MHPFRSLWKSCSCTKKICESKRYPLILIIPSSFHFRRYLAMMIIIILYSVSWLNIEYYSDVVGLILVSDAERRGAYVCPKSKSKTSMHLSFFFFFLQAAKLLRLMLVYWINLSWMIQPLLYLWALPGRGKMQQTEDSTPKSCCLCILSFLLFRFKPVC